MLQLYICKALLIIYTNCSTRFAVSLQYELINHFIDSDKINNVYFELS